MIGNSTSWRRGSYRWVEFSLYKTEEKGVYVLSRVGVSLMYHTPDCEVALRNNLREAPASELDRDATPCPQCRPDRMTNFPIVCPERPRHWAQVCDTAEAVLEALTKYDEAGSRYLTFVAQRLLETAGEVDEAISDVYRVETIR